MTAVDELRAAADKLRTATPAEPAMTRTYKPLAELLETAAEYVAEDAVAHPTHLVRALAVARAVLGSSDG